MCVAHRGSRLDLKSRGPSTLSSLNQADERAESASTEKRALFDRSLGSFVLEGPSTMSIGGSSGVQQFPFPLKASATEKRKSNNSPYGDRLLLCPVQQH